MDLSAGLEEAVAAFKRELQDAVTDKDEYVLIFVPVNKQGDMVSRTGLPCGFHAVMADRVIGEELMGALTVFRLDHLEVGLACLWRSAGEEREHDGVELVMVELRKAVDVFCGFCSFRC